MSYGITEYPNTFRRQANFPLDESDKYTTYAEAVQYAANNPIAYLNQIITVDETNMIYKLQPSLESNVNFKLVPLNTQAALTYNIGTWSLDVQDELSAIFNFDIDYPIDATHYRIFINDEDVSDLLDLSESFTIDPTIFSNNKVTLSLEKINNDESISLIKSNASVVYKNEYITIGVLTAVE